MPQPASSGSVQDRILGLVQTLQFTWFVGHLFVIIGTVLHLLSVVTFRSGQWPYRLAYFGALTSYGVVVYKSHGIPKVNAAYMQRLIMDENVQYMVLAFYWCLSRPMTVTLIPYATFSLFHSLNYIRSNIIPTVFPAAQGAAGASSWQAKTQQRLKAWQDSNYEPAMRFVAQIEVIGIMGRLLLGIFQFQVMSILLYAQFLRFRYHMSSYTRQAFTHLRVTFDRLTSDPRVPPAVGRAYITIKDMIQRFGAQVVQQQQPAR
ncbi:hypothetical protein BCR43DRAFT_494697 [Syncephalastrum racemosum]|uniref:Endoplasmic reticulum protein n=1 Tax=Syncephalastrum racemosum TaxID=13706 RepID=A0A1X2H8I1_SYNRA|nr:hypothetical protein BCR43DRAFT_494697 [Syncephalastrum racemosum]